MTIHLHEGLEGVWAELHAGGGTIRYRRRGAGATTVLLSSDAPMAGAREVEQALARAGRVLVPYTRPWPEGPPGRWLETFLEGLGVHDALLVASHGPAVEAALAVAQRAPEMVRGVAILGDPYQAGRLHRAWIETDAGSRTPLLLAGAAATMAEVLPALAHLAGADAPR
ncbi:MAG: hypothetical protein JNL44_12430 [Gemmatimonadetes bacterium]|nr:hypothetical protein [Gemmatimonadota bacterium]